MLCVWGGWVLCVLGGYKSYCDLLLCHKRKQSSIVPGWHSQTPQSTQYHWVSLRCFLSWHQTHLPLFFSEPGVGTMGSGWIALPAFLLLLLTYWIEYLTGENSHLSCLLIPKPWSLFWWVFSAGIVSGMIAPEILSWLHLQLIPGQGQGCTPWL